MNLAGLRPLKGIEADRCDPQYSNHQSTNIEYLMGIEIRQNLNQK
jgi:hypothetical protein